jgi:hypothetical protein
LLRKQEEEAGFCMKGPFRLFEALHLPWFCKDKATIYKLQGQQVECSPESTLINLPLRFTTPISMQLSLAVLISVAGMVAATPFESNMQGTPRMSSE